MTVDLCQLGVFCHTSCCSRGRDGKLEKRERRTRLCSWGSAEKAYHVQCRERPTDQGPTVQKHPPSTRGQSIICYKLCLFMLHYLLENNILIDQVTIKQRFSIPVLAPPRSAYFVCYSYRFRCLFYSNVSALRSGHHRIFRHDSSSKRTYIFHSKCI